MDTNLLYAIGAIAVLALVARIIINKYKGGNIKWEKLVFIGLMVVAFALVYFAFDPYGAKMWWEGEATLKEAITEDVVGREAGSDIPHFASQMDEGKGRYYVLDVVSVEPTGFYCLKSYRDLINSVERTEQTTENSGKIIKRKMSLVEITRNPGERQDKYLPIYRITLEGNGSVLACMRESDANSTTLPIAEMIPMTDRINSVIERLEGEKESIIKDYYFSLYNSSYYNEISGYKGLIYKAIAGIVAAMIVAIVYNIIVFRRRKSA